MGRGREPLPQNQNQSIMKTKYLYRMAYPDGNLGMISSLEETKKGAWEYAKGLLEDLWLDSVEIWEADSLKFVMRIRRY